MNVTTSYYYYIQQFYKQIISLSPYMLYFYEVPFKFRETSEKYRNTWLDWIH